MLDSLEEANLLVERSQKPDDHIDFTQVAEFIAGQQVRYGRDSGVFIESKNVSRSKVRVFTGEKLQTNLAAKIILTTESTRALVLSNSASEFVQSSIDLAVNWLEDQCISKFCSTGECKYSTIAFMRLLNALGKTERLDRMIRILSKHRDDRGGWKGFPYFFTLLALAETETETATEELNYVLDFAQSRFSRSRIEEPYSSRRAQILTQIMDRFGLPLFNHV
jgi:hypothetical protein